MVTKVMLVDDHPLVREALVHLLRPEVDVEVVAVAGDAGESFDLFRLRRPDVVVMDIGLPDLDGIAATRALVARVPSLKVIMLTATCSFSLVRDAAAAGACGYLLKGGPARDLAPSIRLAVQGAHPLSPEVAALGCRARVTWGAERTRTSEVDR